MSLITDPSSVMDTTGESVSITDISKAQSLIELLSGTDLSSAGIEDRYNARDRFQLKRAVEWQTHYLVKNPDVLSRAAGVTSASANGVSVSYANGADGDLLSPLASKALSLLSLFSAPKVGWTSFRLRPWLEEREVPDEWVTLVKGEVHP